MLEQLLTNPILYSLSLTLIHFLWQGLLVATLLRAALLVIDKSKSRLRYALSCVAMLANLFLAMTTFLWLLSSNKDLATIDVVPINLLPLIGELTQQNFLHTYQELLPAIALFWLAAITVLACKLLIEIYNVNHLSTHSYLLPSDKLLTRFTHLAKKIQLTRAPQLLISLKIDVPMAIGWLKPVVLLPASMVTGLNVAQLDMLLLHELAHIRRYDYVVNFLQTLVEILFFFHPSVGWVAKQMRNEREYCSDDIAVYHCGDPIAYAHTLADTASLCAQRSLQTIPSMAMAASGGDLKARVLRLVGHHCAPSNTLSKWFASTSIILSITLIIVLIFNNQLNSNSLLGHSWLGQGQNNSQLAPVVNNLINKANSADNLLSDIDLVPDEIEVNLLDNSRSNYFSSDNINTSSVTQNLLTESNKVNQQSLHVLPLKQGSNTVGFDLPAINPDELHWDNLAKITKLPINSSNVAPSNKLVATLDSNTFNTQVGLIHPIHSSTNIQIVGHNSASGTNNDSGKKNTPVKLAFQKTNASNVKSTIKNAYKAPLLSANTKSKHHSIAASEEVTTPATNSPKNETDVIWHGAEQLNSIDPIYPSIAKRKGIEIDIKVNFTIDQYGKVKDIEFAQQRRVYYFKSAIRTAIRKWRFLPAHKNEQAIESEMSKIFSFSIEA